jgi:predicted nucleic acid-binding protein
MSWANAGEAYGTIAHRRGDAAAEEFLKRLPSLPMRLVLPGSDGFVRAARIRAQSRISFGGAFAVDLAMQEQGALVTGDSDIAALDFVKIVWVGPSG